MRSPTNTGSAPRPEQDRPLGSATDGIRARQILDEIDARGGELYEHSFREDGTPLPPDLMPKRPCPCRSCCHAAMRMFALGPEEE